LKKIHRHQKHQTWPSFISLIVVSLGILLIRFFPFLLGKTLYYGDNYSLLIPGKIFSAQWLKQGILPLWNPYILGGISWIGDISQSLPHPSTLLFVLFHPATALNLTIIIHLVITFIGMYLLAFNWSKNQFGALIAAIGWMLSTQVSGSINNLATLQSIAWIPWAIYWGEKIGIKKYAPVWFSIIILFQLLGGYPQHVIVAFIGALSFSIYSNLSTKKWGRLIKDWLKTIILSLSLSAWVWMPFVKTFLHSTRVSQSLEQASVGSLNLNMMVKIILPYFFDMPLLGIRWGPAWNGQPNVFMYISWIGMVMLLAYFLKVKKLHRNDWFLIAVIIASIVISMGHYLPGFSYLQQAIPFLRVGRYPSIFLIIANISILVLLARAVTQITLNPKTYKKLIVFLSFGLIIVGIGLYLLFYHPAWLWDNLNLISGLRLSKSLFHTLERDTLILKVIFGSLLINSILLIGALISWKYHKRRLLLVFFTLDLLLNTQGMFFFGDKKIYDPAGSAYPQLSHFIDQTNTLEYRYLTRNFNMPYTDYGMYWEAMTVRPPFSDYFVDAKELAENNTLIRLKDGYTPDWNITKNVSTINGYTTLLPQSFSDIWSTSDTTRINFIDLIDINNPNLTSWSVKYYIVDNFFEINESLDDLTIAYADNHWTVYDFEQAKSRIRFQTGDKPDITTYHENPNTLKLEFTNEDQTNLVIADKFDDDWQAWVNDKQVPIYEFMNMRSIPIIKGVNKIELRYYPSWFYAGLLVSGITAILLIVWISSSKRYD
jgi:hypothetical protein